MRFAGHPVSIFYVPPMSLEFNIVGLTSPRLWVTYQFLLFANIYWGLMNLLPIWPLDGGQISRALFELASPGMGVVHALWVSTCTAGAIAIWAFLQAGDQFLGIFFGYLAYTSYQTLQQYGRWGGR